MSTPTFPQRGRTSAATILLLLCLGLPWAAIAQTRAPTDQEEEPANDTTGAFRLGELVTVAGSAENPAGIGGSIVTAAAIAQFHTLSLERAVDLVPGVTSTFDSNGRRNESDIFVRGFGRFQVPLTVDGVRIYLPADNRLDFGRFLTGDIAAIEIRKGYASVLDGPGAMGGSINLVTRTPDRPFEAEGSLSGGGRGSFEGWTAYGAMGARRRAGFVQASVNMVDRDSWTLPASYAPTAASLQPAGVRQDSYSRDWRVNVKAGLTPSPRSELTLNYTKQSGEKSAPLNVYNNPPVPAGSYWRWPYWDIQNVSLHATQGLGSTGYVRARMYVNTFRNGLESFDDATYTTQDLGRGFISPYDDRAWGGSLEAGMNTSARNTVKTAFHYRHDRHREAQISRPTHPTLRFEEPTQQQQQYTWSAALENTFKVNDSLELVGGLSYDAYAIVQAQEYDTASRTLFEYPKGDAQAWNWQAAAVWHAPLGDLHASISDRARFPVFFELYSTRFGTATPNPSLGPERATNYEVGWRKSLRTGGDVSAAVFYSDVRDLIQGVLLADGTGQAQNVGAGHFQGFEASADIPLATGLRVGGNVTAIRRVIRDALLPGLEATGVPSQKAFAFVAWRPWMPLSITPNIELASNRWSDVNPPRPSPYVRTGAYRLVNLDCVYAASPRVDLSIGLKNVTDDLYEPAWGYPQAGRTFYVKTEIRF